MDYDDVQSDREQSPNPHQQGLLDDLDEDVDDWRGRDRSQTPFYDNDSSLSKSKPRKRLVKKSDNGKRSVAPEFVEEEEVGRKRKKGKDGGNEKRHKGGKSLEVVVRVALNLGFPRKVLGRLGTIMMAM